MDCVTWVEPFAGSAACALGLIGTAPPIGYMGSKRRYVSDILAVAGLKRRIGAESIWLSDAGPWGTVWQVLVTSAADVAAVVDGWRTTNLEDASRLWDRFAEEGLTGNPIEDAARWLWLQVRSASTTPVWWEEGALVMPTGARKALTVRDATQTGPAHAAVQRGRWRMSDKHSRTQAPMQSHRHRVALQKGTNWQGCGGMVHSATLAARLRALASTSWPRVEVKHGQALRPGEVTAGGGRTVAYLDPPYLGCTRYAALCSRDEVLDLAAEWRASGALVIVSEAVALPLDGWHEVRLTDREVLTCSAPPVRRPAEQQRLQWVA